MKKHAPYQSMSTHRARRVGVGGGEGVSYCEGVIIRRMSSVLKVHFSLQTAAAQIRLPGETGKNILLIQLEI